MKKILWFIIIASIISSPEINAQVNNDANSVDGFITLNKSKIYYCEKGNGNVPIIFVSGLGEDHSTWQMVQDSVSVFALTISYDRSGLGRSEYNYEKKDLLSMTDELNNLINLTILNKPFILVGHSLGCQIVKKYASLFPQNIKAIIFIDPGYNEEILKARVSGSMWAEREKSLQQYLPEFNAAQKEELKYLNIDAAIADSIKPEITVPVILFTATKINPEFPCSKEELQVKEESHNLWLKSMPNAVHKIVPESRHYVQNDEPSLIISNIRSLL
jgi:pimeloyl-ACP methyl ester carboxylesterase